MPTKKNSKTTKNAKRSTTVSLKAREMKSSSKNSSAPSVESPIGNGHSKSRKAAKASLNVGLPLDRAAVAQRAWEIWQQEGCPSGRELENWLQAERELQEYPFAK